ncbi:RND family transporter [Pelomonas sp. KK5]|uniref:efflux RND transporter permease subunit n=1 Tax=Pelomonas sp. KK5 TaxID=1855730 RepID=UPI00097C2339|nr:MMPL family transporter [Pelomonas sp. KK5]
MMASTTIPPAAPPAPTAGSGSLVERLIFGHRAWILLLCGLLSLFLGAQLRHLDISASYEKMLPQGHPYIRNYLENRDKLRGLDDAVRIVVANPKGDVFDPAWLDTMRQVNDEIYMLPGVDRTWMKSIWTPVVRWTEVTEEGFVGGPVMPVDYDGSPAAIAQLRQNIGRAGVIGSLVATDFSSTMIVVPLRGTDADGKALDYHRLATSLEQIRQKHEGTGKVGIQIVGFAKLVGDLIDGLMQVAMFFGVAAAIVAGVLLMYTRSLRSTLLVIACSLVAVVWQLGAVSLLHYALDPFSVLVPFLVFAIGVSHGAQKMNGIMQDIGRGLDKLSAARLTFRRLFLAGLTALLADVVGFAVLMVVDIPVIRELALAASLGVGALIFTNLVLLPVLLSYVGVSERSARRSLDAQAGAGSGLAHVLQGLTRPRPAATVVAAALALGVAGFVVSERLQVGDLDAGAPELRPDSRYNRDNAFISAHYNTSSDVFAVIVRTPKEGCGSYEALVEADRLGWALRQLPGVQTTATLADTVRAYTIGSFEGNPKWLTIPTSQDIVNSQVTNAGRWNSEFLSADCSIVPLVAYLGDHRSATLDRIVTTVSAFAAQHNGPEREFLLAAGSAGIEATTNIVVREANRRMLLYVYGAVILLCAITFRSWRAVVVAVLPLALTSILAEALMVLLGIGLKVSTLPVVALGVGIGVDYALYLLSVQLAAQRQGLALAEAYGRSLQFVGKIVALVGVMLALGVVTWVLSPIKFQADMGILLTFMFLWNMVGALVLIPALSHFLLRKVP